MPAPSPPSSSPLPSRSPRRTKHEQVALYDHLVRTSLQLFAEGGYEAISMRRLACAVDMAPMSLYRYFPTKAHLVRHVWAYILARAAEHARAASARARTPVAGLRSFVEAFVQYWIEHPDHYWLVFSSRPSLGSLQSQEQSEDFPFEARPVFEALAELLDALPSSARASPEQRQLLAELLICKILGFLLGTVGQLMPRSSNHALLRMHLLDDIVEQVSRFDAGPAA